jgi:hypothetical protein
VDSLQNGDSLVVLSLVSWSTRYSLHRIVVTPALAFGKKNELWKDFVTRKYGTFRVRKWPARRRVAGIDGSFLGDPPSLAFHSTATDLAEAAASSGFTLLDPD